MYEFAVQDLVSIDRDAKMKNLSKFEHRPKVYSHIQATCLDEYSKVLWGTRKHTLKFICVIFQREGQTWIMKVPDKAKLESAKPPVRIPTISQGGNPRSKEERVMHIAGDRNAIVWHIFRTYMHRRC